MILEFKLVDNSVKTTHVKNMIKSKLIDNNIDFILTIFPGLHPEYLKLVELYNRGFLAWNSH